MFPVRTILQIAFDPGEATVHVITRLAGALVSEASPGWVSLGLLVGLIFALVRLSSVNRLHAAAFEFLQGSLAKAGRDGAFAKTMDEVDAALKQAGQRDTARKAVATAWSKCRETHIIDETDGTPVIRNAVRPSVFFTLEDLGFGPGWLRILPNLFVAIGLFLTFLGLIAALSQVQEQLDPQALSRLRTWRVSLALRPRNSSCR